MGKATRNALVERDSFCQPRYVACLSCKANELCRYTLNSGREYRELREHMALYD